MTPSLELQNETPLPDRRSANDMASTPTGPASSEPAASDSSLVVEQRAREHMNYGNSLARRGATFAAREEFIQALQLIADARDFQDQTRQYTSSLAEGLRALHESDDFVTLGAEQQLNLELAPIVAMHSSDVISEQDARGLRPVQALQAYYQYASEKISHAVGYSRVAGETLHALGKLMLATASYDAAGKPVDKAKAMVMFQAALVACPDEYRSANELGVLMARNGKWDRAVSVHAQPANRKDSRSVDQPGQNPRTPGRDGAGPAGQQRISADDRIRRPGLRRVDGLGLAGTV